MTTAYAHTTVSAPVGPLLTAWLGTLLISRWPEILIREGLGVEIPWINVVWITSAAALTGGGWVIPALRPFRAYFAVMLAVVLLTTIVDPAVRGALFGSDEPPPGEAQLTRLFIERVLLAVAALALVPILALLGFRGRDAYLSAGWLSAPSGLKLRRDRELRWSVLGPVAMLALAAITAAFASSFVTPTAELWSRALPLLPIAWAAAALNAFAEEVLYRAALLGPLASAIGAGSAVWILAVWFGVGHFYGGIPSGVMGLVIAGSLALLFGKAMIDTKGLAWPWALHFAADAAIYTFLALAFVSAAA